jgi:hypothetical protein
MLSSSTDHGQATGKLLSLPAAIRMHPSYHHQVLLVGVCQEAKKSSNLLVLQPY